MSRRLTLTITDERDIERIEAFTAFMNVHNAQLPPEMRMPVWTFGDAVPALLAAGARAWEDVMRKFTGLGDAPIHDVAQIAALITDTDRVIAHNVRHAGLAEEVLS